jgi:hypothetical protein
VTFPSLTSYLPKHAHVLLKNAQLEYPGEKPLEFPDRQGQAPQEPPITNPKFHALKAVGAGALGAGIGALAGGGAANLVNKHYKPNPAHMPYIAGGAALLGGLANMAYTAAKDRETQEIRRAFEAYRNRSEGRVPE